MEGHGSFSFSGSCALDRYRPIRETSPQPASSFSFIIEMMSGIAHERVDPIVSEPPLVVAQQQLYECLNCGERRTIKNRGENVKCRSCDYRVLLKVQSKKCVVVAAR